jgi:hypothetical protein
MIEKPNISIDLLERAHRHSNGELAWRPDDAEAAVIELTSAGYAVLGGEWWTVEPGGAIWPAIPATEGRAGGGVYGWSIRSDWDRAGESWDAFCERAAEYNLAVLRGEDPGSAPLPTIAAEVRRDRPDLWPQVHYALMFVDRERYESL